MTCFGEVTSDTVGTLSHFPDTGPCVHTKMGVNILSFSCAIRANYTIEWDQSQLTFVVTSPIGVKYQFHEYEGLYLWLPHGDEVARYNSITEFNAQGVRSLTGCNPLISAIARGAKTPVYTAPPDPLAVSTPDLEWSKYSAYSKEQIERARATRTLCALLFHPGHETLVIALSTGAIVGCPLTPQDARRAMDLWGPCHICQLGKMRHRTDQVKNPFDRPDKLGLVIEVDFMYFPGPQGSSVTALIAVDTCPLGLTFLESSSERRLGTVQQLLLTLLFNWYKSFNIRLQSHHE